MDVFEFLDYLQNKGNIFVNGIDGRSQHMESYMCVIDYNALKDAVLEVKDQINDTQWEEIHSWLSGTAYLSPINQLASLWIARIRNGA